MRISYNWLKDYTDFKLPAEKLAEVLTMSGLAVESLEKKDGDWIFEIEVTSNRPDWLSYIGIAREISALTGSRLKMPKADTPLSIKRQCKLKLGVKEGKLCPRYTARVIEDIQVKDSPGWLKEKMEIAGIRSVNNVVDVTNFCLFETGEPMHALDLDKLEGQEIIVRCANTGEKIVTIDGVERKLDESILVIADAARPVAIAGVMGGINTEVTGRTKNILLEAAYFDPVSVRRTARKLGITTESSYRFERKVDISNIAYASNRAAALICDIAEGELCGFADIGDKRVPGVKVNISLPNVNRILGCEVSASQVKKALNALGLKTIDFSKDEAEFAVPAFRHDLRSEADLIEEIARIHGYDKFPSTIPPICDQPARFPCEIAMERKIRYALAACGADEILTYSLTNRKTLEASGIAQENLVEILNPLTNEQEAMRPSLIPGMLACVLWNLNRKARELVLFELGKAYVKEGEDKYSERRRLSICVAGEKSGWLDGTRPLGFFDLKGLVETLLVSLGIGRGDYRRVKDHSFAPGSCAEIVIGTKRIGIMGEVNKKALANFDIKISVCISELDVDALIELARLDRHFEELPKFPSVFRDISILVGKDTLNSDIIASAKSAAGRLLKNIVLIDRFTGKQIPEGKTSLTYRLEYQDPSRTLEEKDITEAHTAVLAHLESGFGAKLR